MNAPRQILVVNAGSSSLKLRRLDARDRLLASHDLPMVQGRVDRPALTGALGGAAPPDAIGHRIVHGGRRYLGPVRLDETVERDLRQLVDLAPLHQPKSIDALEAVKAIYPHVPAVASFDTAFHAAMPAASTTYALPREWRERWDLRRYGFHGLSHAYATRRVGELLRRPPAAFRAVICHLGAGASLAAVAGGVSVDTTMGFTPLEGLVMATRSGSVDPGLLMWLQEHVGMPAQEMAATLENRAGLLGLSGTADMAAVVARAEAGEAVAGTALAVYLHRLRASIAAMTAAMGGLDVLVFTGGVGEHAPAIRAAACEGLGFLGVRYDRSADLRLPRSGRPDREIGVRGAPVRVFVVQAREDLQMAHEVRRVLAGV
ncbi:MAG TPA: acetate/propionate family kinase [Candidatus Sulfotelmatobacter sp.]|nr:acetate/propionate family kinase [Candidatus Sulfotelmatobacter sp.]